MLRDPIQLLRRLHALTVLLELIRLRLAHRAVRHALPDHIAPLLALVLLQELARRAIIPLRCQQSVQSVHREHIHRLHHQQSVQAVFREHIHHLYLQAAVQTVLREPFKPQRDPRVVQHVPEDRIALPRA